MDVESDSISSELYTSVAPAIESHESAPPSTSVSLQMKLFYAVGEISNSIKSFTFGLFLLFYYTSVLGLPGTLVGIATAISLVWDAVIDPFIGHLSDGAASRYGRRHPFMFAGAILMGISFFLIFSPPTGLSATLLFAWLIGSNILLRTTNSIFLVPYHALGAELSQDYHERSSITGIRAAFALFGTLVAAGLSFAVFFPQTTEGVDPKFDLAGYRAMAIAFGAAISAFGLVSAFGTLSFGTNRAKHGNTETSPMPREHHGFFRNALLSFRSRSFVFLTVSTSIFFLASVINATLAVHYLTYYVEITDSNALSLFQLSFYVGGIVGVFVWLKNVRHFAKHHLFIASTLILALIMSSAYWLFGEGRLFGTGNVLPLIVGNTVGGFFASALWVVPASMIADVTDEDEVRSGRRREGAFFGIHSFFQQEAAGVALLVAGFLLDHYAMLVPGEVSQSILTNERLGIVFGLVPAALFCISAVLMFGYRLTPEAVGAIQSTLTLRRTAKNP